MATRLPSGWKDWLRSFFRRIGCKTKTVDMAQWGRRFYDIVELDDKKAIKQLAVILMGKEQDHAFKKVKVNKTIDKNHKIIFPVRENKLRKKLADNFYESWEWKKLRYQALKKHGPICMLCGATKVGGARICVDHVKPRATYPELELDISNLQILCNECNMGKGRWDETDWRE